MPKVTTLINIGVKVKTSMSEYLVNNKKMAAIIIFMVTALVIVGFVSYNFGLADGLKKMTPTINDQNDNNSNSTNNNRVNDNNLPTTDYENSNPPAKEIVVAGDPVILAGTSILNGTVGQVTATGFNFNVSKEILNSASRTFSQKTTTYTVTINKDTKLIATTTEVTIPAEGGAPIINTSTKNIKLTDLATEDEVSVFTSSDTNAKTLVATEVRISKNIRK